MSDIEENIVVNGRIFTLTMRPSHDRHGRQCWVGWVVALGYEGRNDGRWSVGPAGSQDELRDRAEQMMHDFIP